MAILGNHRISIVWFLIIVSLMACAGTPKEMGKDAKMYYDAGIGYMNRGQPKEALNSLKKAYELESKQPQILHMLGLAYFQTGTLDTALEYMLKAEKLDPANPELMNNLANVYMGLNKYEEAVARASKAIADIQYQTPAAAYFIRAQAYLSLNQLDSAEADLREATHLDPFFDRPHIRLADILMKKGNLDEAEKELDMAIKANSNNAEAYLLRGQIKFTRGYLTEAEQDFSRILRILPESHPFVKEAKNWLEKVR